MTPENRFQFVHYLGKVFGFVLVPKTRENKRKRIKRATAKGKRKEIYVDTTDCPHSAGKTFDSVDQGDAM